MEDLRVETIGVQIVFALTADGQDGQGVLHWERQGTSGVSLPPWAAGQAAAVARQAAARLHAAADAVTAGLPAEGS